MRKMVMFVSFRKQPKLLEWCMTKIVIINLQHCKVAQQNDAERVGLSRHVKAQQKAQV